MIAAGRGGSIVINASSGATQYSDLLGAYCVTKAAVRMLATGLASELGEPPDPGQRRAAGCGRDRHDRPDARRRPWRGAPRDPAGATPRSAASAHPTTSPNWCCSSPPRRPRASSPRRRPDRRRAGHPRPPALVPQRLSRCPPGGVGGDPVTRTSRIVEIEHAAAHVEDGMTIAIGGFINSGHPMAVVRQLIKDGRRDLRVVGAASAGAGDRSADRGRSRRPGGHAVRGGGGGGSPGSGPRSARRPGRCDRGVRAGRGTLLRRVAGLGPAGAVQPLAGRGSAPTSRGSTRASRSSAIRSTVSC